ncbi:MAG TPA: glycoside hydrolase family 9 protein [Sediminibacterium sp.]|uniref:glycoside hydrolase family 9 protein n=1 Tax=Sediminibacterium sp. TaxID=1917865 RepID=UPI0008B817EB|nr:glycoside hydrolase family 9 protein [Sediminibacterium sp.]OHC86537.1 MAG: cellulase [Sphingobacteriia bacterium RIFOXYC2_FULL_35_18]OHC88646.1 MAG: cellulase [Sphingobacteriia bacterium RIFOXYD2_FULL_35_12]HLD54028.1 glycoside hydrolase family 9 protein [Sediminibacterium sp.]
MKRLLLIVCMIVILGSNLVASDSSWIRINQLGYLPKGSKVAVFGSKSTHAITSFQLINVATQKVVLQAAAGKNFGSYGPFKTTYRLNFSSVVQSGQYYLKAGKVVSPVFKIDPSVYDGTADFCLQYMRQQRSGFNPFLNDSCHTHDGYTLYGTSAGIKDSTKIDASGGWHDASDYLQYSSTTANATFHLLAAYSHFPHVFADQYEWNGLKGKNNRSDILDEAKWGLDWLVKMHPRKDWMFNQLADDRDHMSMRIPKEDNYYGRGFERPVYFINGQPQQRGKFLNSTTGTSSTAAKFSAAFTLAAAIFKTTPFAKLYEEKASSAYQFSLIKRGVTQTASVRSPYIYAEENWVDDMELATAMLAKANKLSINTAYEYAKQEPLTPWLGKDTASHYQWYPFINLGHYELAKQLKGTQRDTVIQFYKNGIEAVWQKAKQNAFYRGVPFIWCSNNLTTSFAIQCKWYKELTNDNSYDQLEQANLDWLFGCNPWGTSMVYGLPNWGDTPIDPHSGFTHLKNYPINGGLVDGPVYTSIYKNLIGIQLNNPDEYAAFQSDLAVYHDDYGDYSTNEPTMDGTASLIYLLAAQQNSAKNKEKIIANKIVSVSIPIKQMGAIIKSVSPTEPSVSLIFTGDEYGEGLSTIQQILAKEKVKAGFFFTGRFYENKAFSKAIKGLVKEQHYLGAHSNDHLLYNDWTNRNKLLVSYDSFSTDLDKNYAAMENLGINTQQRKLFIPPYEWWNDSVASWCNWKGLELFSFTPGTYTNADYTWPEMGSNYKSNATLMTQLKTLVSTPGKLNGNILLVHVGTDPRRKEKLYNELPAVIQLLRKNGYSIKRIDELIN